MEHGFIKVAAATPEIKVADCAFNADSIIKIMDECSDAGAKLTVFPELCITGYTASDLFFQDTLLNAALEALQKIAASCRGNDSLVFVGLPLRKDGRIYNTAAVLSNGEILGFVPKTYLPNYNEFYEKRQFAGAGGENGIISVFGKNYPFGTKLIFQCREINELAVSAEICEDLWVMSPPSVSHAQAGASVIVNLSAGNETVGKAEYRRALVSGQSARLVCAYVYSDAGMGESTTDVVFSGHNIIAENGKILKESALFENGVIYSEIDVKYLAFERTKLANYRKASEGYQTIGFSLTLEKTELTRSFPRFPFVPSEDGALSQRAELILTMQSQALKKRVEHTRSDKLLIGVSGGLDSALALLVSVRAAKLAKKTESFVLGITMPCFGTTERTRGNSEKLAEALKIDFKTIDITAAVNSHLKDISHTGAADTAYENAQARERTQILMDTANMTGGLVVGTGDLSELALGWSTFNGDHMSMYGVNSSVPKTLVKYLIRYEADRLGGKVKEILYDILDTPISPELLPPEDGAIAQKTEDIVGPYALHDFFLYYIVRMGFSPSKVFRIAKLSFQNDYSQTEIKKWLTVFIKRFFSQQFKRSCLPDGVKIGSVALSPRGDWRMPSDASASAWLAELE
jgi:NAD+ synthase (glutamine-hydrolysing)